MSDIVAISLMVMCENQTDAVKVVETLSRTSVGFALEGLNTNLSITTVIQEEEETSEGSL